MTSHKDIFRQRNCFPHSPSTNPVKAMPKDNRLHDGQDKTGRVVPSKKWYDKSGIQGMILFIVMIILDTAQLIQTNDISRFYIFCTGMFLGVFAVGER